MNNNIVIVSQEIENNLDLMSIYFMIIDIDIRYSSRYNMEILYIDESPYYT